MPIKNLLRLPFFKSQHADDAARTSGAAASPAESIELIRKRAVHRLIGAAVLVLIAVIGFPMLFDTQPRPIPVDIPIEIPDKAAAKPLVIPAQPPVVAAASAPASSPPAAAAPAVAASGSLAPHEEIVGAKTEEKPAKAPVPSTQAAIKSEAKPEPKAEAKAEPRAEAKAPPKPDDGRKAQALLEGKDVTAAAPAASQPAGEGRYVVQIGAFADATKAREARLRVEKAGLKTYTQVAETKEGKRIRVRVGPFAGKDEADKAAARIKKLDLPAVILTL